MLLAGVHRSTGLVFDTREFSSLDARKWLGRYLDVGETCFDYLVSSLRHTGYFTQRSFVADFVTKQAKQYADKLDKESSKGN